MTRFIATRLLVIPVALALVNALGFAYPLLAQALIATLNPHFAPPEQRNSLLQAYGQYLQGLVQGDAGRLPGPASPSLITVAWQAAGASLGLLGIAFVLSLILGLVLGLRAVHTGDRPVAIARWLLPLSTVGLAMPSFFLGGLFVAASVFYLLHGGKAPLPLQGFGWDLHLVMPVAALMLRPTAQIAHLSATQLSGELHKQYVVAARSFGHSWLRVRWRTALVNVMPALLLGIGASLRLMIAELLLVEWMFAWPGLGRWLAMTLVSGSVTDRPPPGGALYLYPPAVATFLTLLAALFLASDFVASLLVRASDPRLRGE